MNDARTSKTESFTVAALRARFADESMPWTRPHVESLINQIAELTKQRDEGWDNFYRLRKQVAEEKFPGMTQPVRALAVETNGFDALAAADVLAHQYIYTPFHEKYWTARGGHGACTVCNPPPEKTNDNSGERK